MSRQMSQHPHPHTLVGSALGTTLISIAAVWILTATLPVVPNGSIERQSSQPSGHLYHLSPIPPGADWTA